MASPFVEVAVAVPVRGRFHYRIDHLAGGAGSTPPPGTRVLAPFGGRLVTGVILAVDQALPDGVTAADVKPIAELLDPNQQPALDTALLELCRWVADYYEAPLGEVIRAALPPGTQQGGALTLSITPSGRDALAGQAGALPTSVRRALATVAAAPPPGLATTELPAPARRALEERGFVAAGHAAAAARVRMRTVVTATLAPTVTDDVRAKLVRAPRRFALVEQLRIAGGALDRGALVGDDGSAATALRALVAAGHVILGTRETPRELAAAGEALAHAPVDPLPPTPDQATALAAVDAALDAGTFAALLLHGVTGSGKTEVYLQAIAKVMAHGRGALVLVPEIALTPQLSARFRARFGDSVAVMHSGLTDGERFEHWRRLRSGRARIAVGARSAVFAPVPDLGMIVVDEEHDASFKQEEGVRYHARDVALLRAQRAGVPCLLGSATPSLESYAHARGGRYTLCELLARPTARPMPTVEIVDLRQYKSDGEGMLTAPLAQAIESTLDAGEQVILFLNRRGFATFIVCVGCGHSFRCPQCAVSLTYHREGESLRCHYCGHAEHVPITCPKCQGAETVRRLGLGTERIEAAVAARFPSARVARLDRDTAGPGRGVEQVLGQVARREVDILVGTQMVTKGHDFPGVTLVGVLCADTGMNLPDFRASERTFQLLTQVAGRAGRGDRPGRVIVQTFRPEHPAVTCAQTHDYQTFFAGESAARAELGYPPSGRVVALRLDGPEPHHVRALADALAARAQALAAQDLQATVTIMGPAEAPLARLRGRTRWHVWLRAQDRTILRTFIRRLCAGLEPPPGVRLTVDVDPVSAL